MDREFVNYNEYYDSRVVERYEKKPRRILRKVGMIFGIGSVAAAGYVVGHIHGRNKAIGICRVIMDTYPDQKESFTKVWNEAVKEYFGRKKRV